MRITWFCLSLLAIPLAAQTINPNQIRPCSNGQVLMTVSGVTSCSNVPAPFEINSFTGGQTVEIGATVTNPSFAASYSSTPDSAQITNTAGIDSPLVLTSPFTSGTVTGSFVETTATNVTFTLSATSGYTQTATQNLSWQPRYFGGVGTAGATGATASGTSAVLTGATGTLASAGIANSQVGAVIGSYSPTGGQYIYLFLTGSSHTFIDNNTGFAMVFNAPIFVGYVNSYGATVPMYLYQSSFGFSSGTYAPKVVS